MTPAVARYTARIAGTLLVVAACNVPGAVRTAPTLLVPVAAAAALAWWLAPMADERPPSASARLSALARRRGSSVVAGGAVVLAAVTGPPLWLAGCVTALLIGYLLLTDAWTAGATVPRGRRPAGDRRVAGPLIAVGACAAVFAVAALPVSGATWSRLPAALVLAATVACLLLALLGRGRAD